MSPDNPMYTCCILGHRSIRITEHLKEKLYDTINHLITEKKVNTFLFGSKSAFVPLCHEIISRLKEKHPHIKRVYVRAEFPVINDSYKSYLLAYYDHTYYPNEIANAGRAVYVERNYHMINNSQYCIIYYNDTDKPSHRKSGTELAFNHANKSKKTIILFP